MRLSKLFTKTLKEVTSEEKSVNARLLERAGFVSKQMAGVYNYLPLGLIMLNKINKIIREEINAVGGQEILMPALTSLENYKKTKRDNLDILFRTKLHSGSDFVLNQSHEEVVTPLVQKYVNSYKDLPVAVYQIQTKFRNEPRARSGLLRGREFVMKDLYSFHADEKDLDNYYKKVQKAYFKIFERFGLGKITHLVYASGGTFSKFSHEYQTVCKTGEDSVYLCKKCGAGVNKEIIDIQKTCPECGSKDLEETRSIEVGNIFKLKTKFSDAFDMTYQDNDGKEKQITMGCYGIGPSRVMGTIAEVFNDDNGMILPESVAPYKYHIIILNSKDQSSDVKKIIDKLGEENCLVDDRDISAGQKFADADLMGMPIRVVLSKKTLEKDSVEMKKRDEEKSEMVKISQIKN